MESGVLLQTHTLAIKLLQAMMLLVLVTGLFIHIQTGSLA